MKKYTSTLLAFIMILALAFSFAGCGSKELTEDKFTSVMQKHGFEVEKDEEGQGVTALWSAKDEDEAWPDESFVCYFCPDESTAKEWFEEEVDFDESEFDATFQRAENADHTYAEGSFYSEEAGKTYWITFDLYGKVILTSWYVSEQKEDVISILKDLDMYNG